MKYLVLLLLCSCSLIPSKPNRPIKTKFSLIDKVSTLVRTQINKNEFTLSLTPERQRSVFVVTLIGVYSNNKSVKLTIKLSPVRTKENTTYFICNADITITKQNANNQGLREHYKIRLTDHEKFIDQINTILNNSL